MEERLEVNIPGESRYEIVIEPGLLAQMQTRAADFGLTGKTIVTSNTMVAPLYGETLAAQLPNAALAVMPDGEPYKTLDTVAALYGDFVAAELDRSGTVAALGGGVVGDMAGFAAATFMRGVRLVQIPTTLLAMVDSSVGGKVGVDLPQGKNLVGAFKQPDWVLIDPHVLKTLPDREWRCGMAEVIKHGLLADTGLLEMVSHSQKDNETDTALLVRRAVQVKVNVVQQDPYEQSIRAHLNLGHTFGHAIENVSHYQWLHGEGVGLGLIAAARLSHRIGLCDASLPRMTEEIVASVGLPTRLNGLDSEAIYTAMGTDKKRKENRWRFILLRDAGQPMIVDNVTKSDVIGVLEELQ